MRITVIGIRAGQINIRRDLRALQRWWCVGIVGKRRYTTTDIGRIKALGRRGIVNVRPRRVMVGTIQGEVTAICIQRRHTEAHMGDFNGVP